MDLKTQIQSDMKEAMKAGDKVRRDTLRLLLAAIKNAEIDQRRPLDDGEMLALVVKQVKQREETIAEAEQAGRDELAAEEKAQLEVLLTYMPSQLSRDEIIEEAQAVIAAVGASGPRDMGRVMRALMPTMKGRADGKLVNQIVRELLAQ